VTVGKPGQSRSAKFGEKEEKRKAKMSLWYILAIPKCKNISRSALKLHLISLKLIVFQYNYFIQTSKISKNHFFPNFPSQTNIYKCNNSQNIWDTVMPFAQNILHVI
jgi:hypothetical protein